ncbi:hypothetical protein AMATHDRAFT_8910 [Amanita thiersii Skay4041]|uniref:Uncharacterized protein n=1 Tax=Amanita thiersii Skay4041 TaxID=703135 RepID=A0A2A9NBI2_9AGAR|nr:hypothetical protein AMATHDRAFT_8910 [Amanita thiersii Skay4041]
MSTTTTSDSVSKQHSDERSDDRVILNLPQRRRVGQQIGKESLTVMEGWKVAAATTTTTTTIFPTDNTMSFRLNASQETQSISRCKRRWSSEDQEPKTPVHQSPLLSQAPNWINAPSYAIVKYQAPNECVLGPQRPTGNHDKGWASPSQTEQGQGIDVEMIDVEVSHGIVSFVQTSCLFRSGSFDMDTSDG